MMRRPNRSPNRPIALLALALCTLALGGCGNTLQDQPISHTTLENLILAPFPVYWLGGSFQRMAITEASEDPSGAYTVQYGDCAEGGQNTCVARLRVVTSPDNSFIPAGSQPHRAIRIRGVTGVTAQGEQTIELPTAGVVVGIYADSPVLARAAADTAVPINDVGALAAPLPSSQPDTGFGEQPLPGQALTLLRAPN
ncbi:MAG TPA: hypothetical protein VIJ66_08460 [Solirubrobacteraceae bacterium]